MLKRKYSSGAQKRKAKKLREEYVKKLPTVADFYKRSIVETDEDQSNEIEVGGNKSDSEDDTTIDIPSKLTHYNQNSVKWRGYLKFKNTSKKKQ